MVTGKRAGGSSLHSMSGVLGSEILRVLQKKVRAKRSKTTVKCWSGGKGKSFGVKVLVLICAFTVTSLGRSPQLSVPVSVPFW